jgi:hypothetical protein
MIYSKKCEELIDKTCKKYNLSIGDIICDFENYLDEHKIIHTYLQNEDEYERIDVNDIIISFYENFSCKLKNKEIIYFYNTDNYIIYINETEDKVIDLFNQFIKLYNIKE